MHSVRNGVWVVVDFVGVGYFSACAVKSNLYNSLQLCASVAMFFSCKNLGFLCLIPDARGNESSKCPLFSLRTAFGGGEPQSATLVPCKLHLIVRSSWPLVATRNLGCRNLCGYTSWDCYLPKKRSSLIAHDRWASLCLFGYSMGMGGASVTRGMLPG